MRRLKQDFVAAIGEFVGTTLFLFLAFGGAKTAQFTRTTAQTQGLDTALGNQTIIFIAVSFGLSLLVTAWVFYRVTGGLFNPAVTLALYLIGGVSGLRAVLLVVSQLLGGIAAAALVAALTPFGGAASVETKLGTGVNIAQGLFIEAFLTAVLILTILLLAAEKHKSTYLAPIGIGLALLVCHLFGVVWTGCGMNPARSFGPSVVSASFPGYHWIYWVGPFIGTLMAVGFYLALKAFDYTSVVFGQDATNEEEVARAKALEEAREETEKTVNAGVNGKSSRNFFNKGKSRFHIVFHPRNQSVGKPGPVEPVRPEPFDPENGEMATALQAGAASLVDLSAVDVVQAPSATSPQQEIMAEDVEGQTPQLGYPSMKPVAQDRGGLQAPGTDNTGFAMIPYTKRILS